MDDEHRAVLQRVRMAIDRAHAVRDDAGEAGLILRPKAVFQAIEAALIGIESGQLDAAKHLLASLLAMAEDATGGRPQ